MNIAIASAFEGPPPELDFVLPGFLAGTVGALIAPGSTGKSFWALEAAMGIAGGKEADILKINPSKQGKVLYYAAEDPPPAIIRRVHALGAHLNPEARKAVAENLKIEAIMGQMLNIAAEPPLKSIIKQGQGMRLIIFDTLSRIHTLDENNNGDMALILSRLEHVAAQTGASVLFLHHTSKASVIQGQGAEQTAARGASALVDNARWVSYVIKMTEAEAKKFTVDGKAIGEEQRAFFLRFGISKMNYDTPQPDLWLRRATGGVLLPANIQKQEKNNYASSKL